jgi:hypothetical protein
VWLSPLSRPASNCAAKSSGAPALDRPSKTPCAAFLRPLWAAAGLPQCRAYLFRMSLRLRRKPPAASYQRRRGLQISLLAHNRALHYLANHPLTEDERAHLTEVVHGYTGPCDVVAAREGLAWLRERYRERGERAPF